jgi:hypothetical protein
MPSQPNNQFGTNSIATFRYWYEKWIYVGWPFAGSGGASSLGVGNTPLISNMMQWNPQDEATLEVSIDMLQGSQDASVLVNWIADPANVLNFGNNYGATSAFRGGARQTQTSIRAVTTLQLSAQNNNAAAQAGWQTNYAASIRHLTVAEKLAAQANGLSGYDLTGIEQEALRQLNIASDGGALKDLINKGSQPFYWQRVLSALYYNRIQEWPWDWNSISVSSSGATPLQYNAARSGMQGRVPILTGLIVPGAPNVTLNLQRDGQGASNAGFKVTNLAGWAQTDDEPWDLWMPARDQLILNFALGPGNAVTTTCNIGTRVATVELDEILAVHFGLVKSASSLQNPDTFWKTLVGWV